MPDRIASSRHPTRGVLALAAFGLLPLLLAACQPAIDDSEETLPTAWHEARQMVLVTSDGWDATAGTMQRYERDAEEAQWQEVGASIPVMLGRNGTVWGLGLHPAQADGPQKQEGDGRAPAGVFSIGIAFGYGEMAETGLAYAPMDIDDWCIDVNESPLYNRIVSTRDVGEAAIEGSTEPMRRDLHADGDVRYKLGFVIDHNPQAIPGGGSCIFAHLWRQPGETTAGCTAMEEPAMLELLAWLDPGRKPVFVVLPDDQQQRLAASWNLPHPAAH